MENDHKRRITQLEEKKHKTKRGNYHSNTTRINERSRRSITEP